MDILLLQNFICILLLFTIFSKKYRKISSFKAKDTFISNTYTFENIPNHINQRKIPEFFGKQKQFQKNKEFKLEKNDS